MFERVNKFKTPLPLLTCNISAKSPIFDNTFTALLLWIDVVLQNVVTFSKLNSFKTMTMG